MTLLQLADNVWVFPPDSALTQPSIGIIVTPRQTILVDAGNSPSHAERIVAALKGIQAPPVRYIIYTHHHWDHVLGAQIFNVPVIAHVSCYELLCSLAAMPWNAAFVEAELRKNPLLHARYDGMQRALADWSEVRYVLPTMTFSQQMTLHMDGVTLLLEHVGGQHAEDSIIVRVPEAHVTFLGDCWYSPPYHLRTPESTPDWSMLARLVDASTEMYIVGHDLPASKTEIQALLAQNGS
jgi:glyoxylase-like metal-dependent hydrolase (beta-lactamase superfamily II)